MSLIRNLGLINIKPQNFKLNKFNQNPIIFKGNIPDTFEKQGDNRETSSYIDDAFILNRAKTELKKAKEEQKIILNLLNNEDYVAGFTPANSIKNKVYTILRKTLKNEYNLEGNEIDSLVRFIAETMAENEDDFDAAKTKIEKHLEDNVKNSNRIVESIKYSQDQYRKNKELYENMLKEGSYLAEYYNPDISDIEKLMILKQDEENFRYLPPKVVSREVMNTLSRHSKAITPLKFCDEFRDLYDLNDPTNKETINELFEDGVEVHTLNEINKMYDDIPTRILNTLPIKFTKGVVRLTDENRAILEKASREYASLTPKASKYCYGRNNEQEYKEIPALELKKMGYSNVASLRKMVEQGILDGRIEEIDTPKGKKYKTFVSLQSEKNIQKFPKIMAKGDIIPITQFAQKLGMTTPQLREHVRNGDVDIVREYLFPLDKTKVRFNAKEPKTQEFIQKIQFERELAAQAKKSEKLETQTQSENTAQNKAKSTATAPNISYSTQKNIMSLRMKLVWHFCPKTREVASNLAKGDGYLAKIIEKENDQEELTNQEEVVLNTYRKNIWTKAGTDELKEAFEKAREIYQIYSTEGIEAIEDEEIRKIIEEFNS